jgi:hypothetical protein
VTEADWLTCEDPRKQVEWLRGVVSDRKLRLFVCAFWRRWWRIDPTPLSADDLDHDLAQLLDYAEQWAEQGVRPAFPLPGGLGFGWHPLVARNAHDAANWTVRLTAGFKPRLDCLRRDTRDGRRAAAEQTRLLREIMGHPFRPPAARASPAAAWEGGLVRLAQAVYAERSLSGGTFDRARLAVLADALDEAGADAELADHCRGTGPHVRGCWAVDVVLEKS